jgi:hypothetical protein
MTVADLSSLLRAWLLRLWSLALRIAGDEHDAGISFDGRAYLPRSVQIERHGSYKNGRQSQSNMTPVNRPKR